MRYLFGDCVFDTDCHTLERQGQSIRLQPREFKMLAYLLDQRHRVVSRQELFEQIWPGQYVGKAALEGCIKQVRQAIGDSGRMSHNAALKMLGYEQGNSGHLYQKMK